MRRLLGLVLVTVLLLGLAAPVYAGGSTATNVALGLAAFAVFNQLVYAFSYPPPGYPAPYVFGAPAYPFPVFPASPVFTAYSTNSGYPIYAASTAYGAANSYASRPAPAATSAPMVVSYPHGRYELRGNGMTVPYQWVWIWNPPPAPVAEPKVSPTLATR